MGKGSGKGGDGAVKPIPAAATCLCCFFGLALIICAVVVPSTIMATRKELISDALTVDSLADWEDTAENDPKTMTNTYFVWNITNAYAAQRLGEKLKLEEVPIVYTSKSWQYGATMSADATEVTVRSWSKLELKAGYETVAQQKIFNVNALYVAAISTAMGSEQTMFLALGSIVVDSFYNQVYVDQLKPMVVNGFVNTYIQGVVDNLKPEIINSQVSTYVNGISSNLKSVLMSAGISSYTGGLIPNLKPSVFGAMLPVYLIGVSASLQASFSAMGLTATPQEQWATFGALTMAVNPVADATAATLGFELANYYDYATYPISAAETAYLFDATSSYPLTTADGVATWGACAAAVAADMTAGGDGTTPMGAEPCLSPVTALAMLGNPTYAATAQAVLTYVGAAVTEGSNLNLAILAAVGGQYGVAPSSWDDLFNMQWATKALGGMTLTQTVTMLAPSMASTAALLAGFEIADYYAAAGYDQATMGMTPAEYTYLMDASGASAYSIATAAGTAAWVSCAQAMQATAFDPATMGAEPCLSPVTALAMLGSPYYQVTAAVTLTYIGAFMDETTPLNAGFLQVLVGGINAGLGMSMTVTTWDELVAQQWSNGCVSLANGASNMYSYAMGLMPTLAPLLAEFEMYEQWSTTALTQAEAYYLMSPTSTFPITSTTGVGAWLMFIGNYTKFMAMDNTTAFARATSHMPGMAIMAEMAAVGPTTYENTMMATITYLSNLVDTESAFGAAYLGAVVYLLGQPATTASWDELLYMQWGTLGLTAGMGAPNLETFVAGMGMPATAALVAKYEIVEHTGTNGTTPLTLTKDEYMYLMDASNPNNTYALTTSAGVTAWLTFMGAASASTTATALAAEPGASIMAAMLGVCADATRATTVLSAVVTYLTNILDETDGTPGHPANAAYLQIAAAGLKAYLPQNSVFSSWSELAASQFGSGTLTKALGYDTSVVYYTKAINSPPGQQFTDYIEWHPWAIEWREDPANAPFKAATSPTLLPAEAYQFNVLFGVQATYFEFLTYVQGADAIKGAETAGSLPAGVTATALINDWLTGTCNAAYDPVRAALGGLPCNNGTNFAATGLGEPDGSGCAGFFTTDGSVFGCRNWYAAFQFLSVHLGGVFLDTLVIGLDVQVSTTTRKLGRDDLGYEFTADILPDGTGTLNSGLIRSFTIEEFLFGFSDQLAVLPVIGELLPAYFGYAGPAVADKDAYVTQEGGYATPVTHVGKRQVPETLYGQPLCDASTEFTVAYETGPHCYSNIWGYKTGGDSIDNIGQIAHLYGEYTITDRETLGGGGWYCKQCSIPGDLPATDCGVDTVIQVGNDCGVFLEPEVVEGKTSSGIAPKLDGDHKKDVVEEINYWVGDIRRSINLSYVGELEVAGLDGHKYALGRTRYGYKYSTAPNPDNKNYRMPYDGIIPITTRAGGVPAVMSLPHFLYANTTFSTESIDGFLPDEEAHPAYIVIEPITGSVVKGAERLQQNLMLDFANMFNSGKWGTLPNYAKPMEDDQYDAGSPMMSVLLMPAYWIERFGSIDQVLTSSEIDELKEGLYGAPNTAAFIFTILLVFGILFITVGGVACYYAKPDGMDTKVTPA